MKKSKWLVSYVDNSKSRISAFPIPETCTVIFTESLEEAKSYYDKIKQSEYCEKAFLTYIMDEYNKDD